MPLEPTSFYRTHLADLHQRLLASPITCSYLTGTGIRFDGVELRPGNEFDLPFGTFSTVEFAHLFSIFNGSRVHQQAEKSVSEDEAPPGLYFTIINPRLLQSGHKNRVGVFQRSLGMLDLFISDMHMDHFFLNERHTPPTLGTLAFSLCAITAHLSGLGQITLVAAGGQNGDPRHIGYKVWPKFGFDAPLLYGEIDGTPHLAGCTTVQDVIARDEAWWVGHGTQRHMTFDLTPASTSWRKLLAYANRKLSDGKP